MLQNEEFSVPAAHTPTQTHTVNATTHSIIEMSVRHPVLAFVCLLQPVNHPSKLEIMSGSAGCEGLQGTYNTATRQDSRLA